MFTKETSKMIFSKAKAFIPIVMEKPTKASSITIDLMERVLINGLKLVKCYKPISNKFIRIFNILLNTEKQDSINSVFFNLKSAVLITFRIQN